MLIKMATLFGLGHLSKAPGTLGSLATLPLCYVLLKLGPLVYMAMTVVITLLAIVAAERYERQCGKHDSKEIVIDETVGMLVTMTWLPMTWQSFVIGFVLFRALDIIKPFPVSYFDRHVPGGFGVVADDLVAGIIASVLMQLMLHHTAWLGVQIQNFG